MGKLIAITLTSQTDAEAVRDALLKLSQTYQYVSWGDYLHLVGIPTTFSDQQVGWAELTDIPIQQVGENEFVLKLPEALTMRE